MMMLCVTLSVAMRAPVLRQCRSLCANAGPPWQRATAPVASASDPSERLCLIDGHAVAYRMHFALQKTAMSTRDGRPSHALHGFCMKLLDLCDRYPDHRMLVAFDTPGPTFRSELRGDYKATRAAMPQPLRPQIEAMQEACACLGLPAVGVPGFEADDLIATSVAVAQRSGRFSSVVIVAADKDMMQLISDDDDGVNGELGSRVEMWNDQKKRVVRAADVFEQFGVRPNQMGDLLALMGDSSDNVPGVPGVGPKGAAQLLREHDDLEGVLAAALRMKQSKRQQALVEHAEQARLARQMVALRIDVPLAEETALGCLPDLRSESFEAFVDEWQLSTVRKQLVKARKTAAAVATGQHSSTTTSSGSSVSGAGGLSTSELALLQRIESDPSLLLTPRYKVLSEWISRMELVKRRLKSEAAAAPTAESLHAEADTSTTTAAPASTAFPSAAAKEMQL